VVECADLASTANPRATKNKTTKRKRKAVWTIKMKRGNERQHLSLTEKQKREEIKFIRGHTNFPEKIEAGRWSQKLKSKYVLLTKTTSMPKWQ
jgi:hypothetical protein